MVIIYHSGILALLLLSAVSVANAIRTLRDGPMTDADGREYKLAGVTIDTAADKVTAQSSGDASTIRIRCTGTAMLIMIHADLYNNGRHISSGEVCLGQAMQPCNPQCQAFAVSDTEYVIEAELPDCGSRVTISDDLLIYSNELVYTPAANPYGITRRNKAVVPVSCHYKRTHLVSSHPQQPPLAIATPTKPSSEFSLKLMTDNWRNERSSNALYLGEMLFIKASYNGPDHESRRLFVDNCVATLDPDVASVPRYYFIENHGCFTDAKDERSNAQYETRVRSNTLHVKNQKSNIKNPFNSLQLKLDAFLFHQDPRNSVFITCKLKATTERSSPTGKACNYANSRWTHVDVDDDHNDDVCSCCQTICNTYPPKGHSNKPLQHADTVVHGMETLDVMVLTRE